jgi:ribosomal protein RSM22 (predicted rRNA methylase)
MDSNTHSDAEFGQSFVENDPLAKEIHSLSADGAYYRQETIQAAKEKGLEINLSNMTGRKVDKDALPVNGFVQIDQAIITHCPAGHKAIRAKYDFEKKVYTAKFDKTICAVCPFQEQCPMNEQKKYNTVRFTEAKLQSDTFRSGMNSDRHKELSRFRAVVEGVVSALRRKFGVDDLPVRGFLRSKIWLNAKIVAYNFKMIIKYQAKLAQ